MAFSVQIISDGFGYAYNVSRLYMKISLIKGDFEVLWIELFEKQKKIGPVLDNVCTKRFPNNFLAAFHNKGYIWQFLKSNYLGKRNWKHGTNLLSIPWLKRPCFFIASR